MGGSLCLPFPAPQPAGFSPSRGAPLVLPAPSLFGDIPVTAALPPSLQPRPALSGHPPCLFRWNRRGNESQSPPLTPSWDFAPIVLPRSCCFQAFDGGFVHPRGAAMLVWRERKSEKKPNNLASTKQSAKNTDTSQPLQKRQT